MKLAILLLSVLSLSAAAQQDTLPKQGPIPWWITLGLGTSPIEDETPVAILISASFNIKDFHLITPRLVAATGPQQRPFPRLIDAGILYGYTRNNSLWYISASAGISYISITRQKIVNRDTLSHSGASIGLPWQLQIHSKFSSDAKNGLGFVIGGNVNKIISTYLLIFCFTIGFN